MKKCRRNKIGRLLVVILCTCMLVGCSMPEAEVLRNVAALQEETSSAEEVRDTVSLETGQSVANKIENVRERYADRYAFHTLSETEQMVYDEIYRALTEYADEITVSTKNRTLLDQAYDAVYADYGELFWSSGYTYTEYTFGGSVRELKFCPKYTMTMDEKVNTQQQIDAAVQEIIKDAPVNGTDYDKALFVYEYLIDHVEYDADAADNQNIVSVFLYGRTVCEGYARATQYLLEQLGIQAAVVGGMAKGASHAWNLLRLDGEYYYMDTTWGDNGANLEQEAMEGYVNYNYFAVTSEELFRTHTPGTVIELPECTATADNYYVKEGIYVSEGLEAADKLLQELYETGNTRVSIKFSTDALYHVAYTKWITDSGIFDLCNGLTNLYYIEDRDIYVLTFVF